MPTIANEEFNKIKASILEQINFIAVTKNITQHDEDEACKDYQNYLNDENINIESMNNYSIHYIISKLSSKEQIDFIKNHLDYIKENDEEIFLYNLMCPKSLLHYLSLDVLKEIKKIDKYLIIKILNGNYEHLTEGFNYEDFFDMYTYFYDELKDVKNMNFINNLYFAQHIRNFESDKNLKLYYEHQLKFMRFIIEKYKEKINAFNSEELLRFISYIEDINVYKDIVLEKQSELSIAFSNISSIELARYLSDTSLDKQEVLIYYFSSYILKNTNIKTIIDKLKPKLLSYLYDENPKYFSEVSLEDWIKISYTNLNSFEFFKKIFDDFDIKEVNNLFKENYYEKIQYKIDAEGLMHIENRYRKNILTNGKLINLDCIGSMFSDKYIKNINELDELLKKGKINKESSLYKSHLNKFIFMLRKRNIISDTNNSTKEEVEKLFYRIVKGLPISILLELNTITEIALFNRVGEVSFFPGPFSVKQIQKYNVKLHKKLCHKSKSTLAKHHDDSLILKLFLMVGYKNAEAILNIDSSYTTLEHLVGNVDVKTIKLDESGNPILNKKIMNLLFNAKNFDKIKNMLLDKDNDVYKFFPRIFSEWEMIKINNKDESLNTIIDFLKSDTILMPPEYSRLQGLFKYMGCSNSIVDEALMIHDDMLKRKNNTIPRISGEKGDYTYEILKSDDMEGLVVGNKTDCCFTVLGNGYSCLKHATTSKNGRILVIKKNGELIAHSWLWRNGDLLCLDNIEISKKLKCVDFFDVYLQFSDDIIKESYEKEGIESCIKNVTIGFTSFDKKIEGIEKYPCMIDKTYNLKKEKFGERLGNKRIFMQELPQPIEEVGYSDSKNVQYLINGSGKFKLQQSNYFYDDDTNLCSYIDSNINEPVKKESYILA